MKQRSSKTARRWALPLLALLLVTCAAAWPAAPRARAARETILVIVGEQSGIRSISRADLRRCFLGMAVTMNGLQLVPFNHAPSSGLRERFDEAILNMSLLASQRYWIDSMIRSGNRAPRTVSNSLLLTKVVAKLPGAIGYVEASALGGAGGINALSIDGISPDDPRYPLR